MADKLKITGVSIPSSLNAGDTYDIAVTVQNITTTEYLTVAVRAVIQSDAAPWFTPSQQVIWPTGNPSGIPPYGAFVLQGLTMPNQAERVYVQAYYWDGANWVEGAAYAKGPYDIKLIGGTASLYGGVQDIHSNPIASAKLVLSGPKSYTTYSDSKGNYSFVGFPTGTYTLTITKAGYKTWGPNTYDFSLAGRDYQVFAQLSAPTPVVLGGLVKDKAGNLITEAMLTLDGLTATSDSRGEYSFGGVERKRYTITCKKAGYKDYNAPITTDVAGDTLRWDIVMEAVSGRWITYEVKDNYYMPAGSTIYAEWGCPIAVDGTLFEEKVDISRAVAYVFVTPTDGVSLTKKIKVSYVGFKEGKVEPYTLLEEKYYGGEDNTRAKSVDVSGRFYGLGVNMFLIRVDLDFTFPISIGIGFDVLIQLTVLAE